MQMCFACSMPLEDQQWIGLETEEQLFCIHCIDEEKNVKSCEEIFQGGVAYFLSADANATREFAEKLTRTVMNNLPYWQDQPNEILSGEKLTAAEVEDYFASFQG